MADSAGEPSGAVRRGFRMPAALGAMALRGVYVGAVFAVGVVMARALGPAAYGAFSLAMAWVVLGADAIRGGVPALLVREVSGYRQDGRMPPVRAIVRSAERFTLLAGGGAGLLLGGAAGLGLLPGVPPGALAIMLPALVLLPLMLCWQAATRGLGAGLKGLAAEFAVRPGTQLLLLLLLWGSWGFGAMPLWAAAAAFLASVATAAGLAWAWARTARGRGAASAAERGGWRAGFWRIGALMWIDSLNVQLPLLLLGAFASDVEAGQYRVAWQLAALVPFAVNVLDLQFAPAYAAAFRRGDTAALDGLVRRHCLLGLAVSLPVALALILFGAPILALAFGPGYAEALPALRLLAAAQLAVTCFGPVAVLLLSGGDEALHVRTQLLALAANAAVGLALVPALGALGAAAAFGIFKVLPLPLLFRIIRARHGLVCLPPGPRAALRLLRQG